MPRQRRGPCSDGSYRSRGTDKQRPLGIAALEDKFVQRTIAAVHAAIYEEGFLGFSYGFRPGRGRHDALDALSVAMGGTRENRILDAGTFEASSTD